MKLSTLAILAALLIGAGCNGTPTLPPEPNYPAMTSAR